MKTLFRRTWLHPRYLATRYIRQALDSASVHVHGAVLDVGSGLSPYRDVVQKRAGRYVSVDWPSTFHAVRPAIVGDALNLPIRDHSFDTVLATELIEHLSDPGAFLREAKRVLRDRGTIILSAPFFEPIHEEPRDYFRFTSFGLRALLESSDFVVEQIWRRGGANAVLFGGILTGALYNTLNPEAAGGRGAVRAALLAPFCAVLQIAGWFLDAVIPSDRYTLGYVVAARLRGAP